MKSKRIEVQMEPYQGRADREKPEKTKPDDAETDDEGEQ